MSESEAGRGDAPTTTTRETHIGWGEADKDGGEMERSPGSLEAPGRVASGGRVSEPCPPTEGASLAFEVGEQLGEQGPPPGSSRHAQEMVVDGERLPARKWLPRSKRIERNGAPAERLRPAYRGYMRWWALMLIGASLLVMPWWPMAAAALLGADVTVYLEAEQVALLNVALFGLGGVLLVFGATTMIYRRLANRFYLTPHAVTEERGLIARHVSRVQLVHIRTVDVRQSVLGRLLGIGSIHFASAGTGADDVTWHAVPRPVETQLAVLDVMRLKREHENHGVTD